MYSSLALLAREAERHVSRTALPHLGDATFWSPALSRFIPATSADHLRTIDRPFSSEATSAAQALEDGYRAITTSSVTRKRTKKGTSAKVVKYGRSVVVGDSYPADVEASRVPAMVIEHAIETARRTEHGADGIALARIATLAYDLPDLIGGEFASWSEVLDAETSALVDWNIAGHTTGAYIASNATKVSWPTRYRVPAVRLRKGELGHRTVTFHDGQSVTRFVAPSANPDRAFIGHHAYVRPSTRGTRSERAARARHYDAVALPANVDQLALVAHLAEHLDKGHALRFTTHDRAIVGTLRRSPGGKLSAVVGEHAARNVRTVSALLKVIAPAFN